MTSRKCPYCQNPLLGDAPWNKVFCCHAHRVRYKDVINAKELFRLTEAEKKIYEEHHGK